MRQLRFDDNEQRLREDGNETPERLRLGRQRNGGMEVNSDDVQDFSGLEDETDGMGAIVFSAEQDCGFFGISFLGGSDCHAYISRSFLKYCLYKAHITCSGASNQY
jgi:hypothetical protein